MCRESVSHSFRDWPLDGPCTTLSVMKHIDRFGPMPTSWLEAWARRKHVSPTDRAFHELRVLAESFEMFGCYDHVNVPCLAGIEVLMRRFQTLLEAHAVPGAKPNYTMAGVYSGTAMLEDAVAPDLRVYGAKKLKEKALEGSVHRGGLTAKHAEDGDDDDTGAAGTSSAAGGTKGGGGRGAGKAKAKAKAGLPAPPPAT